MSAPHERAGEPSVYARLAQQSEMQTQVLTPPRGTRIAGWLLCMALVATILIAASRVPAW